MGSLVYKWTRNKVIKEAEKYKTPTEFFTKAAGAYDAALKYKMMNKETFPWFYSKRKPPRWWNVKEHVLEESKKYNPYGTKTKEEITKRCVAICDELISHDVKTIVIACNTATSACVKLLREKYDVDIIGMEPALKVACDRGEHQRIAVWATQLTLSEKKFANLMNRFKDEHHIIKVPCPELVRMVEDNKLDDASLVESCLKEYLAASDYKNLDSIVLGCTHFPFYTKYLEKLCPKVHIIEGSVGTTLHTKDLLEQKGLLNTSCEEGQITWMNTMDSKIELSKCLFKKLEVE